MTSDTKQFKNRFEIDDKGFKIQMSEMELWRLIQEIISNSFDEKSVKEVNCSIVDISDNEIEVEIQDDGNGFKDIKDIFTLYKDSYKRTNPEQAGRFNLGEKQFFAVAKKGWIRTKDAFVEFDKNHRKITKIAKHKGTHVYAVFETKEIAENIIQNLKKLAVKEGKRYFINGDEVPSKQVVKKFKTTLWTVIAEGKDQKMNRVKRDCDVFLYEKSSDEDAIIYELGIPVQRLDEKFRWHVDVRQKIPQTTERSVVSTNYLQTLYSEIVKNTIDLIGQEDASSNWINQALKKTDKETSQEILKKQFGTDKVLIRSTSDYRANESAEMDGAVLVSGSQLDPDVRDNLKKTEVIKYASKEYGTNAWETAKSVQANEDMIWFAKVCQKVARDVIKREINVSFITSKETNEIANYNDRTKHLQWNVRLCGGKKFFNYFSAKAIGILVHELAHDLVGNNDGNAHFSHEYLHEMERIAGLIGLYGITNWTNKVNINESDSKMD